MEQFQRSTDVVRLYCQPGFPKGWVFSYQLQYNKSKLNYSQTIMHRDAYRSCGSGIQEDHRKIGSLLIHDVWAVTWEDPQELALEQLRLKESLSR